MEEIAKTATELLLPVVLLIAGPALAALSRSGVRWFAARTQLLNIEQERAIADAFTAVIDGGVAYAEARALRWAQERDQIPPGAEKLEAALTWIVDEAQDRGLPELGRDRLVRMIESRLGTDGAPGGLVRGQLKMHELLDREAV